MALQYHFLRSWIQAHTKTERGASLVEYALLVALIAVVCIAAVTTLGGTAKSTFTDVSTKMTSTSAG